jgi:hypothetical protein
MAQQSGYWRAVMGRALPAAAVGLVVGLVSWLVGGNTVLLALAAATATLAITALLAPRATGAAPHDEGPGTPARE